MPWGRGRCRHRGSLVWQAAAVSGLWDQACHITGCSRPDCTAHGAPCGGRHPAQVPLKVWETWACPQPLPVAVSIIVTSQGVEPPSRRQDLRKLGWGFRPLWGMRWRGEWGARPSSGGETGCRKGAWSAWASSPNSSGNPCPHTGATRTA